MAPSRKPATTRRGWVILGLCSVGLVYLLATRPLASLALVGAILAVGWMLDRPRGRRVEDHRWSRGHEDFTTFARAITARGSDPIDPRVVRAVWEELLPLTALGGPAIPLRPSDRFAHDLGVDPGEVEELMPGLVERCGRMVGYWHLNPHYTGLSTVEALVHFISAQPPAQERPRVAAR